MVSVALRGLGVPADADLRYSLGRTLSSVCEVQLLLVGFQRHRTTFYASRREFIFMSLQQVSVSALHCAALCRFVFRNFLSVL